MSRSHPFSICTYIWLISVASKEGIFALKQVLDVLQAADLELLRVLVDHFPLEGVDQRVRVEEDGTLGEVDLALPHRLKVLLGHACLPDSPGGEVHDVVTVGSDLREEVRYSGLGPVTSDHGQEMAENVGLCDRSIDV